MTNPQRDAQLEQWLRQSSDGATAVTPECLDFEALAALVDNGLSGPERERALVHAAGCARCQGALAALGRTFDIPPTVETAGRETFLSHWWRWLVPATAAATAVVALAVWVRTPVPASSPAISSGGSMESVQTPPPPEGITTRDATPVRPNEPGRPETTSADSANAMRASEVAPQPQRLRSAPATSGPATERFAPETAAAATAKAADANSARPENPPVAVMRKAPQRAPEETLAAPPPASPVAAADSTTPAAPAPSSTLGAGVPRPAAAPRAAEQRVEADSARPLAERAQALTNWTVVLPTSGVMRWRFTGNRLEASTDGGATWQAAAIRPAAAIRAGSAPMPRVCWLVGDGGLVLRTVDGDTWQRAAFPESVDLTAVVASDGTRARVTLADGRVLATTDAGRTWMHQ